MFRKNKVCIPVGLIHGISKGHYEREVPGCLVHHVSVVHGHVGVCPVDNPDIRISGLFPSLRGLVQP